MKKLAMSSTGLCAGLAMCVVAIPSVHAQTVVKQADNDRVQVVDYRGKPPFKRQLKRQGGANATEFARFEEQADAFQQPVQKRFRKAGPPGKSVPYLPRSHRAKTQESAEFSRFEESDTPAAKSKSNRLWRGAPGKQRRLLTD